jgi:excisionase family DNA binding protein
VSNLDLFTKRQIAEILSCHISTVNKLIAEGEIEVVQIHLGRARGGVRITREALDDYLRRHAVRVGQEPEPEVDDEEREA